MNSLILLPSAGVPLPALVVLTGERTAALFLYLFTTNFRNPNARNVCARGLERFHTSTLLENAIFPKVVPRIPKWCLSSAGRRFAKARQFESRLSRLGRRSWLPAFAGVTGWGDGTRHASRQSLAPTSRFPYRHPRSRPWRNAANVNRRLALHLASISSCNRCLGEAGGARRVVVCPPVSHFNPGSVRDVLAGLPPGQPRLLTRK